MIGRAAPCRDPPAVLSAGDQEPSLLLAVGTGVRFGDAGDAAQFLAQGGCRVVLVAAPLEADFIEQAAALHLALDKPETVAGATLDEVRPIEVGVYTATSLTGSP